MRRVVHWIFEDRSTGRLVVGQWPNLPLWIWIVASVVGRFTDNAVVGAVAAMALAVWAILEVAKGVNPFRRILGAVVLLGLLARVVR